MTDDFHDNVVKETDRFKVKKDHLLIQEIPRLQYPLCDNSHLKLTIFKPTGFKALEKYRPWASSYLAQITSSVYSNVPLKYSMCVKK